MTETRELQSVVAAAEQAAAAGDYPRAEQLLTEAALVQEASLGPHHPDLANTLNNLAVVCEIVGKPADAERYFRRAHAIATATLEPDHPFVATSRKNLEDFCSTRGIAVDAPASPPAAPTTRGEPTRGAQARPPAIAADHVAPAMTSADVRMKPPASEEPRPVASGKSSRPIAIAALIAGALLMTLLVSAIWRGGSVPADVPAQTATDRSEPIGGAPKAVDTTPTTPAAPTIAEPPSAPPAAAASRPIRRSPSRPPVVAAAQLCETLSTGGDWQCVPPSLPVGPGSLFFYSRLKSPADTTVQHRWYRGDRLRQSVELRIRANTSSGYRTFSRQTVGAEGAGDWRVELRTSDGVMLHEERFVVR